MSTPPESSPIGQLFKACDLDGSGFIDRTELAAICTELDGEELGDVFKELDSDGDGRITIKEFAEGFKNISESLIRKTSERRQLRRRSSSLPTEASQGKSALDEGLAALSCQDQVCELYQQLHDSEVPHLLSSFENIILGVIKDVRQQQLENQRLEHSFIREKEQHERHLHQLEEELEMQMQKVESSIKKEEQGRIQAQMDEMKEKYESEIADLQKNLQKLQNVDIRRQSSRDSDDQVSQLKARVEQLSCENRTLRSSVTDAETNLALLRSELASVRHDNEEKMDELKSGKDVLLEYESEQQNLTRQLHMLQDANKKLHDTNDDLRAALENTQTAYRKISTTTRPPSRTPSPDLYSRQVENLTHCDPMHNRRFLPAQESCEVDSQMEEFDSGLSTLRDFSDMESEGDFAHLHAKPKLRKIGRLRTNTSKGTESNSETESPDDMDTEIEVTLNQAETDIQQNRQRQNRIKRGVEKGDRSRTSSRGSTHSVNSQGSVRGRKLPVLPQLNVTNGSRSSPDRVYKIVLAGDAAVGKSSFIMRLCKGKFVANLNSTLGVDFQTKSLEIDGRSVALQLWDTAGQERFRSIAKSYFRRADGVLLLYDCTHERSYVNVRDWMEAIEDGAQKQLPIMVCANKTDARDEYKREGRKVVAHDDGQRLAREYNSLFIETSAKDGSNVIEAVTELARWMKTDEDMEIKAAGMQLHLTPRKQTEKKCC